MAWWTEYMGALRRFFRWDNQRNHTGPERRNQLLAAGNKIAGHWRKNQD